MKTVAIVLILVLTHVAATQESTPQRTLRSLVHTHQEAIEKASRSGDKDAYEGAISAFCAALREFMKNEAKGDDVHLARFELVHALMSAGKESSAKATLAGFPAASASPLMCAEAALLADTLGIKKEYEAWVAAALAKPASFAERMELGVYLMSTLRKPELGTKLYESAFAAAKNDEQRATVRWHQARATREREDIPDEGYGQMLQKLAQDFPRTKFGSIAADRLRAMGFTIGADPIPIRVDTFAGKTFSLAEQAGKAVLVLFWSPADARSGNAVQAAQDLHREYADQGLVVLGIALGPSAEQARRAAAEWKATFPLAFVPGDFDADLALRYRVDDIPHCFLVGRDGKISGMNFILYDESGRKQVIDAVQQALATKK